MLSDMIESFGSQGLLGRLAPMVTVSRVVTDPGELGGPAAGAPAPPARGTAHGGGARRLGRRRAP